MTNKEKINIVSEAMLMLTGDPYHTMTPKDQRNITNDWSSLVPDMKRINSKPMLLCKRLGPILVYLSLHKSRSGSSYESSLLCHPLHRDLFGLVMTFELRGLSNITLKKHESEYKVAFEKIQAKASFQLKEKVSLKEVVTAYRNYIVEENCNFSSMIYDQALIPAWAGDHELAQESLEWAIEHQDKVQPWNMMGVHKLEDGNEWISDLRQKIANPELLREIVKSEVKKHKLEKIPFYNFVDAPYQK